MIRAILIDDEEKALKSLSRMVTKYLPFIEIIHATQSPLEGIEKIKELKPDLVFLDIDMPKISGFDLLMNIGTPNFEIIFVTAHNQFAIEAIQHAAIGYIVKPIDSDELIKAGENAKRNIELKTPLDKNLQLLQSINKNNSTIIIPTQKGMSFFKSENIIRLEGLDGYTQIIMENQKPILSSYSIGKFKELLVNFNFFQTHKSHVINMSFIKTYLNEGTIELENGDFIPLSKARKEDFMNTIQRG